jgi:nucleotide-binding universal stress UspA family protein
MVWTKICCAIDFTEHSHLTLEEACALAKRIDADLRLVHVYEPPLEPDLEPMVSRSDLYGDFA